MVAGLAVSSIAVVLYGLAPVLQAVGPRAALASLAAAVLYDDTTKSRPAFFVAAALTVVGRLLMAPAGSAPMAARE